MDCDNQETEATKTIGNKTADEMLHEMEYEFIKEDNDFICYKKIEEISYPYEYLLDFNKKAKSVIKSCELYSDRIFLNIQELQAINKKCEELGWNK